MAFAEEYGLWRGLRTTHDPLDIIRRACCEARSRTPPVPSALSCLERAGRNTVYGIGIDPWLDDASPLLAIRMCAAACPRTCLVPATTQPPTGRTSSPCRLMARENKQVYLYPLTSFTQLPPRTHGALRYPALLRAYWILAWRKIRREVICLELSLGCVRNWVVPCLYPIGRLGARGEAGPGASRTQ